MSVDVTGRVSEAKHRRGFLVTSFLFPVAAASRTRPGYTAWWMIRPVAVYNIPNRGGESGALAGALRGV